jgi:hypothetical protein
LTGLILVSLRKFIGHTIPFLSLTGYTQGAITDFKAFIASTSDEDAKAQRQGWVDALQKGENPFTPEVLEELR